jgi:alcohol sulfotransferase
MTHIEKIERHWKRKRNTPSCIQGVKFVSFPRSGRTWYMYMVTTVALELGMDSMFYFGHGGTSIHTTKTRKRYEKDKRRVWGDKKVILLVRHPLDVAVSGYHYLWTRLRQHKFAGTRVFDYIRSRERGLPYIVEFMNDWAIAGDENHTRGVLFVRYEDDVHTNLSRIFEFAGVEVDDSCIRRAIELCTFEAIKRYDSEKRMPEVKAEIWKKEGLRVTLGALRARPDAAFARKGQKYGFRQELSQTAQAWGREYLKENLHKFYAEYVNP